MICRVGKLGDRPKWSMISGKRWGATGTKLEFPRLVFSLRLLFLFLFSSSLSCPYFPPHLHEVR